MIDLKPKSFRTAQVSRPLKFYQKPFNFIKRYVVVCQSRTVMRPTIVCSWRIDHPVLLRQIKNDSGGFSNQFFNLGSYKVFALVDFFSCGRNSPCMAVVLLCCRRVSTGKPWGS